MIYVHPLSSNYPLSVWVTVQQLPKALVACFYKSKQIAQKASLHLRLSTSAGASSQQNSSTACQQNGGIASHINRSSQCPWEKQLDMFDTGANTSCWSRQWDQPSQEPRCCATKKSNISLSIIWRHQEPAAGEKRLISSVTSGKKKEIMR